MTWREDADACALVYRETGAAPRERSSDPEEVRLARWLVRQRRDFRGGIPYFTEERRAYLDEVYPDWDDDPDDTWIKHAFAVTAIVAEIGRYPSSISDDEREKFFGSWLVHQRRFLRSGAKRLTNARIEKLSELLPGWDDPRGLRVKSDDTKWRSQARRYVDFVRTHRRPPYRNIGDPAESRLYYWIVSARRRENSGSHVFIVEGRGAFMDELLPGWRSARGIRANIKSGALK